MGVKVDLRVLELLASRVCHDLISPIGAVGNGLELMEDADDEMSDDALKLSVNCVRRASALLEFFRMAYGTAGSDAGLRWENAKQLAEGLVDGPKTTLVWGAAPAGLNVPAMAPKLALNLVLLGTEMLPRGGEIASRCRVPAAAWSCRRSPAGAMRAFPTRSRRPWPPRPTRRRRSPPAPSTVSLPPVSPRSPAAASKRPPSRRRPPVGVDPGGLNARAGRGERPVFIGY